jgi:hypothetical protein
MPPSRIKASLQKMQELTEARTHLYRRIERPEWWQEEIVAGSTLRDEEPSAQLGVAIGSEMPGPITEYVDLPPPL